MAYTNAEGRQQVLDELATATDQLGSALASLGEAYELLDEHTAGRLEEELFRPLQAAYGSAQQTHARFAARHELTGHSFTQQTARRSGAKDAVEGAIEAVRGADETLASLQDSMLPVEVGDPELRAGLTRARELIGALPGRARELLRTLGR